MSFLLWRLFGSGCFWLLIVWMLAMVVLLNLVATH